MNYLTIDKELLFVVSTVKGFQSMLLGAEIHIYTDHKNILSIGDSPEWHLHWISYVNAYGPTLHYIEGSQNVIADTFSRLSCTDNVSSALVGKKVPSKRPFWCSWLEQWHRILLLDGQEMVKRFLNLPAFPSIGDETNLPSKHRKTQSKNNRLDPKYIHTHRCLLSPSSSLYNDTCNLNLPENMVKNNPLDIDDIKEKQNADIDTQHLLRKYPQWFSQKTINVTDNFCVTPNPVIIQQTGKLFYPMNLYDQQLNSIIKWQVILGAKDSMTTYVRDITTATYADLLSLFTVISARGLS